MRMCAIPVAALLTTVLQPGSGSAVEAAQPSVECPLLLDRTLATMEAGPLLKEEFATGLMWLRLDAQEALEAGDAATCFELARRAAALVKVD